MEERKLPWPEQVRIAEKRQDGEAKRKHLIGLAEQKGNSVAAVKDIREAMEAKRHFEGQGKTVRIVGGTSKPFVFFK